MFNRAADVLITGSMIYYLDLRFRVKPEFPSGVSANWSLHRRLRKIIVRTVECNLLSLFAQAVSIGLFNSKSNVGFYFVITDMTLAKIYTFSLLIACTSLSLSLPARLPLFLQCTVVTLTISMGPTKEVLHPEQTEASS
ncbi:hypothetical protein BT96DRAFT_474902 [Gymnopus androsaceus JB14]|uniref:DUF6534 domain-containing protein n=1 Tax=Gymnopus androsaceus JB14 TaxID=1447944 RepID=A0A6A4HZ36_9AGAR|nr:hypothetical protein BT96DRAFT_474902 [Gymnopus androsaceus JB14]